MKANINDLLDKAEDPSTMIDQTLRNLREDLAKVKEETAKVIAEEKGAKRALEECEAEIAKMDTAARRALAAGNEGDARTLIAQKQALVGKHTGLQASYDVMKANADKTRQMHDKLVGDIATVEARADAIKAKAAAAKAQEKVNSAVSSIDTASSLEAIDRLEARVDKKLDAAAAMSELNIAADTQTAEGIAEKYTAGAPSVEDELARMKAELGI
jgi:phage shock protein A